MADSGPELRSKGAPSSQGRLYDYNRLRAIRSGLEQAGWGKPYGATAAEVAAEREIMAGLPGMEPTDYAKYLAQTQEMGKLQLALAMAQAGFTAAGTPPREGEWAATTLGRGLAPLAPLVGEAATNLQKQKMALELAKKQEARDLSLAAYKTATTGRSGVQDAALDIFKAEIKAQKGDGFWKGISLVAKDEGGQPVLVENEDGSRVQVVQDKQDPSTLHNIRGGSHTLKPGEYLITAEDYASGIKAGKQTLGDTPRLVVKDIKGVVTKVKDTKGRPIQVRFDKVDAKNLWQIGTDNQYSLGEGEYIINQTSWNDIQTGLAKGLDTWFNLSDEDIVIGDTTIEALTHDNIPEQVVNNLDPKDRQKLIKIAPKDFAQKPYMIKFGEKLKIGEKTYHGGDSVYFSDLEFSKILTPEEKSKLVPDDEKADARRGNQLDKAFQSYQINTLREEKAYNLEKNDIQALLGKFSGRAIRGEQAVEQLTMEFSRILSRIKKEKLPLPQPGVSSYLKIGKEVYDRLKGVQRTWEDLPYEDKAAFSVNVNLADPKLQHPEKSLEIFQAARKIMQEDKEKYEEFELGERQDFNVLLKVYAILDRLSRTDIDLLERTGVFEGFFSRLGSEMADWPIVGSEKSGQLAVLLKQLSANLKNLQASASDPRPSNYRTELIMETAPKFMSPVTVNRQNIEMAKQHVAATLKSFGQMKNKFVIPREMQAMAKEWGIKFPYISPKAYYWKDPAEEIVLPYTRDDFQAAMGDVKFSFIDFIGLKPGRLVPGFSKDGKRWQKAVDSSTHTFMYNGVKRAVPQVIQIDAYGNPIKGTERLVKTPKQK